MNCSLLLFVIFLQLLSVIARPVFDDIPIDFLGSDVPDENGVYRHSTGRRTQKQLGVQESLLGRLLNGDDAFSHSNAFMNYEAKLIDGLIVHNLDKEMSVEHVECSSNFNTFFIYLNNSVTPTLDIQSWKEGEVVYGSTGWGCEKEETEEDKIEGDFAQMEGYTLSGFAPISAVILRVEQLKQVEGLHVWLIEANYVHMSKFFEHLDLQIGAPAQATGYDILPEPTDHVSIELVMNKPTQFSIPPGARDGIKDNGEVVFRPYKSDVYMNGDVITVAWVTSTYSKDQKLQITITNQVNNADLFTFLQVDNTGSFSIPPVNNSWPAGNQYIISVQEDDCTVFCSDYDSQVFAVKMAQQISFNSPMRDQMFYSGDSLPISYTINDFNPAAGVTVYLYLRNQYFFDSVISSKKTNASNDTVHFYIDDSFSSSNQYYIEVDYNCYDIVGEDMFCSYASSEFFSIVATPSVDKLQWILPNNGDMFVATNGTNVTISFATNFSNDSDVQLLLMMRRVGWDIMVASASVVVPALVPRLDGDLIINAIVPPSTNYYIIAQWGCNSLYCSGTATSKFFAISNEPDFQFSSLPETVLEGSNITLTWDSTISPQMITVAVRTSRTVLWDQSKVVGTVNSADGIFTWTVDNYFETLLWNYYFEFYYDCYFEDLLCTSAISPTFHIRHSGKAVSWNYNNVTNSASTSPKTLWSSTCAQLFGQCNTDPNMAGNNPLACSMCNIPHYSPSFNILCTNCYSKLDATVNVLTLKISWGSVTEFKVNLSSVFYLYMTPQLSLQLALKSNFPAFLSYTLPIYALPPFSIAGFSLSFGFYADLKLLLQMSLVSSLNGGVSVVYSVANSVYYDSTVSSGFNITQSYHDIRFYNPSLYGTEVGTITFGMPVDLRFALLAFTNALTATLTPQIVLKVTARCPAFAPTPTVPDPTALYKFGEEMCQQNHYIQYSAQLQLMYTLAVNFHLNISTQGYVSPSISAMSGCAMVAPPSPEKASIVLAANTSEIKVVSEVAAILLVYDFRTIMNVTCDGVVVESWDMNSTDPNIAIVTVQFIGDNGTGEAAAAYVKSAASNPTSPFYSAATFVLQFCHLI